MKKIKYIFQKFLNNNYNNLTKIYAQDEYYLIIPKINKKKTVPKQKLTSKMIRLIIIIFVVIVICFSNYIINTYKNMMPRLTPDINTKPPSSITEIFNSRQLYITDYEITSKYLKYIRPINEKEEKKYKKKYSDNETYIHKKIFEKRPDQYSYKEFCKLALEEKLIDNTTIEYNNTPDISVIIPSYNKKNILLKSIRTIQNQNFKNIEIIIVNDCSTDNSTDLFNYLLKTDSRIRIFHHMKNMGCWRSRLDGIIYSKGKYIILFDAGDFYEDNYVLEDTYNIMEKFKLDSCKFLFRIIRSYKKLGKSEVFFHVGSKSKIVYGTDKIIKRNRKVFHFWGNIWNRLARANIYIKGLLLLNKFMLNLYKNVWDDSWYNRIINKVSFSYAILERVGYIYLQNGRGAGSPNARNKKARSKLIMEYLGFLHYNYNFSPKYDNKTKIINKLRRYNENHKDIRIQNLREHFDILNNLLELLINDPGVTSNDKEYLKTMLKESKERENNFKK